MLRRRLPPLLLVLALLSFAPGVPAQAPGGGVIMMRPDPITGLNLTALQETPIDLPQGATTQAAFLLRNEGNETLQLAFDTLELAGPDAPRLLTLRLDATNATLAPGAETTVRLEVTLSAEAPNGTQRRAALVVAREGDGGGTTDAFFAVRAPGECVGCPAEDEGVTFIGGPGGGMGAQPVRRTFGGPTSGGNASARPSPSTLAEDHPYEETPGPGAAFALAALAGVALAARRLRGA